MNKWMLLSGALFSLTSVMLGAFAAHGLKNKIDETAIAIFQTAATYQMTHGLALVLCGLFAFQLNSHNIQNSASWINYAAICFIVGILFFSGSLYGLALTGQKWLGPITPLGGLLFIAGWVCFSIAIIKN